MTVSPPQSGAEHAAAGAALTRPTRARYGVLAFSVAMAVIFYLDRMAISVAMPAIAEDLNLEIKQVADSVAAFFWCYALCQVPFGWLGDRWGGRRALTAYVVAWSLAIAGLGLAGGLVSLIVMRGLLGVGQAGAYATTASFLRRWMPFGRRGFANSAVSLGGRAGGALAPALTSICMGLLAAWGMHADRWRGVFIGYGVLGIVWAIFFWRWIRDVPRLHAGTNAAEQALIGHDETAPGESSNLSAGRLSLGALVASRDLQFLALANFAVNLGWIFVGTLLPTYLIAARGQGEIEAGLATSLAAAAGMAGCLCGGVATDWLVRRGGLVWGRRLPGMISYGGAALLYAICFAQSEVEVIVALVVIASFFGDFALGAMWAAYQDIGGPRAGAVFGYANMCGNIGAACAASLVPRLADQFGWPSVFAFSCIAYCVGALAWLGVDPRRKIRRSGEPLPDLPHGA